MKKTILTAVVVALAASANAGSLSQSKDGSSKISSGALSMSANTIRVVVEGTSSAVSAVGSSLWNSAKVVGNASVFVLENPSEASSKVGNASKNSTLFVLDKSGQILQLTIEGSKAFVSNPIESTSNASRASKNASKRAIEVTIDASGRVFTASGRALKNTYGEDVQLVMDGASDIGAGASAAGTSVSEATSTAANKIYELGKGSVVAVYNGSVSTVKFIGETVVDSAAASVAASGNSSAAISAGDLYGAIMAVLLMPADAFAASAQTGYQNGLAK